MSEVKGVLILEEVFENEERRLSYKIEPRTTTLADITSLYSEGIDAFLRKPRGACLEAQQFFRAAHETKYTGAWHMDAVILEDLWDRGDLKEYRCARFLKNIARFNFRRNGKEWEPKTTETHGYDILLPPTGIIVPIKGNIYNTLTGTPYKTVKTSEEAIQEWIIFGLTDEQARQELSMFYVGDEEGLYSVGSWSGGQNGPLSIDLRDRPWLLDLKHWFG